MQLEEDGDLELVEDAEDVVEGGMGSMDRWATVVWLHGTVECLQATIAHPGVLLTLHCCHPNAGSDDEDVLLAPSDDEEGSGSDGTAAIEIEGAISQMP